MTLITENYEDSIRGVLDWKILVYFNSRRFFCGSKAPFFS